MQARKFNHEHVAIVLVSYVEAEKGYINPQQFRK